MCVTMLANVFFLVTCTGLFTSLAVSAFLNPDPLLVVTEVLEAFARNQTDILAAHLTVVHESLANHTKT